MDLPEFGADTLVEAIDDAVVLVDGEDRIAGANSAFADLTGWDGDRRALSAVLAECDGLDCGRLVARVRDREEGIVEIEAGSTRQFYRVSVSPLPFEEPPTGTDGDSGVGPVDLVLLHDVTDQQRQQRELERQNERLDQFASLLSHDLRNPLDVAIGRTNAIGELADSTAIDHPEVADHVAELETAHARMRQLIDDVLALARHGSTIESTSEVALADVARAAWAHVNTGDATLAVGSDARDATVDADDDRLSRAFENLFRNAVEHGSTGSQPSADDAVEHGSTSPPSQAPEDAVEHGSTEPDSQRPDDSGVDGSAEPVTITLDTLDDRRGFFVADDGAGLDLEACDRVFEPGYSGTPEGTGLGLAIVAEIAEAHGWEVTATESGSGGARFEFRTRSGDESA
jgi:signal transduction histidine kinase